MNLALMRRLCKALCYCLPGKSYSPYLKTCEVDSPAYNSSLWELRDLNWLLVEAYIVFKVLLLTIHEQLLAIWPLLLLHLNQPICCTHPVFLYFQKVLTAKTVTYLLTYILFLYLFILSTFISFCIFTVILQPVLLTH